VLSQPLTKGGDQIRERCKTIALSKEQEQLCDWSRELQPRQDCIQQRPLARRRHGRVDQHGVEIGRLLKEIRNGRQVAIRLVESALMKGDVEEGPRVSRRGSARTH
jgi:hypothetical protein